MKGPRRIALAALAAAAVATGLAAWLGPADLAWSARALVAGPQEPAWDAVPADSPVLVAANLRTLLSAPVVGSLAPRIERLAQLRGLALPLLRREVGRVVATPQEAVVTGVLLSPGLLPRFDRRWTPLAIGSRAAVTDGKSTIVLLEPGRVLVAPAPEAERALALAGAARGNPAAPLPLDQGGVALAALVRPDEAMRRQLVRQLPPQAAFVATAVQSARVLVVPAADVGVELLVETSDPGSAALLKALFVQVDGAARIARRTGPLAAALLGRRTAELLADVPPLEVSSEGSALTVRAHADAQLVDHWLARAETALGATAPGRAR